MTATVVLPTYNEAQTIRPIVSQLLDAKRVDDIVVVDDDSPDETWRVVTETFTTPSVRVIRRTEESGLASAVLCGFDEADSDRLVCMDADGQHPPEAVPQLVAALDQADLAVGSRHNGGANDAAWSPKRVAMSFGASAIAWTAVPDSRPLQDPMSGMFAVRAPLVAGAQRRFNVTGYKVLLELLARCPIDRVAEIPITFEPREAGESKTDWRENVRYVHHIGRLAVAARRRPRPSRIPDSEVADVDA